MVVKKCLGMYLLFGGLLAAGDAVLLRMVSLQKEDVGNEARRLAGRKWKGHMTMGVPIFGILGLSCLLF